MELQLKRALQIRFLISHSIHTHSSCSALYQCLDQQKSARFLTKSGLDLIEWDELPTAEAIIVAVAHKQYMQRPVADYLAKVRANGVFIDVKSRFSRDQLREAGLHAWRL